MKLLEAIQLKGRNEIPDCIRDDLPQFFVDMGYETGAEIGVYKGEFTEKFCKAGLKMYAIDPWVSYKEYNEKLVDRKNRHDFLYGHTQRVLARYPGTTIIRKTSMEAVNDFEDESLDFVYIDGHHGFKFVAEDLWEWSKKVRKGGVVSGHDYVINKKRANDPNVLHIKWVVDAFVQAFRIEDWYILGSHNPVEGEKRDRWRSWMWIKK